MMGNNKTLIGGTMKQQGLKLFILMTGLSLSLVGCNEFQPGANGQAANSSFSDSVGDVDNGAVDMEALNKELDELEASMSEVQAELNKIDIPLLVGGSQSTSQSIDKKLRSLFDKLVGAVSKVFVKTGELRQRVQERMAKLDPMNPLHIMAIMKLNEALAYLDQLESRLGDQVIALASQFDNLIAKVEKKILDMDQSNPLTWVVMIYWQQIKLVILEYKQKLIDLAP